MTTARDIVEQMARMRMVEKIASAVTASSSDDIADLCQIVYLALLGKDNALMADLWENGGIEFYVIRIVKNQYFSEKSPYYQAFGRHRKHETPMSDNMPSEDE